jgi:hypothetical protein
VRKPLATILTLAVLGAALWWTTSRRTADTGSAGEPQSVVWRMIDESKIGDVEGYLDCFVGEIRRQLQSTVDEMSSAEFSSYLQRSIDELKGVAVFDVEQEGSRAVLTIEYLYQDESERQRLELRLEDQSWRIASAEASRRKKSLIPYGTPIELVE